jgi:ribonucleoside-triphosphate reductase
MSTATATPRKVAAKKITKPAKAIAPSAKAAMSNGARRRAAKPKPDKYWLTFRLPEDFIAQYMNRVVDWGFPCGGGNSLGEINFLDKYSRLKADGTKERWYECCRRVVEGTYTILKNHCKKNRTPWDEDRAIDAAEEMYDRLFCFKWTPPGRGLWMMGSEFVFEHGSAALQNCAFVSTKDLDMDPILPFTRLMEMSMLGIGVGFDTRGAGKARLYQPAGKTETYVIPDSREGFFASVDRLLRSYLTPHRRPVKFDYSKIRPEGSPIKGFGGTTSGPEPLRILHEMLVRLLDDRDGQFLTDKDITDIQNLEGKCVVSGSVRRSAEIAFGDPDSQSFIDLKNPKVNPERMGDDGWGYLSNNSVFAKVGGNYDNLVPRIAGNGEPGLFYLELAQQYGRMVDPPNGKDHRALGANPCVEQTLEHLELCTLVETFLNRHDDLEDYKRTIKVAYLYAKAVTLMSTHWPDSNEVMQRNRRIGCSITGIAQFLEGHDWNVLRQWCDQAYTEIQFRDNQYSDWLGVRESIKTTSVKPSGTVSLLGGATPGVHWPVSSHTYIRRIRFRATDPKVELFRQAGYNVEPDVGDPLFTVVVDFPTEGPNVRNEHEVSVWEKISLAALMQEYWADNQVSATITFSEAEQGQIGPILAAFEGRLKSISFLPLQKPGKSSYAQLPYEAVTQKRFAQLTKGVTRINTEALYSIAVDAEGEKYCANDVCEVPQLTPA